MIQKQYNVKAKPALRFIQVFIYTRLYFLMISRHGTSRTNPYSSVFPFDGRSLAFNNGKSSVSAAEGKIMDKFVELKSKIVSVTVYRTGARVTRAAKIIRGDAGFHTSVSVANLPLALEDGSVRVRVEASEQGAPLTARNFRVVLDTVKGAFESPDSLRNELEAQAIEVRKSEKLLEILNGFKNSLLSSSMKERPGGKRGEPPIESPVECRLKWIEFRRNRLSQLELRIEKQKALYRELAKKRDALSAKLNEASNAEGPRATELRKALVLTLDVGEADANDATLYIDYLVPGAGYRSAHRSRKGQARIGPTYHCFCPPRCPSDFPLYLSSRLFAWEGGRAGLKNNRGRFQASNPCTRTMTRPCPSFQDRRRLRCLRRRYSEVFPWQARQCRSRPQFCLSRPHRVRHRLLRRLPQCRRARRFSPREV
jgi:hypothetical protein